MNRHFARAAFGVFCLLALPLSAPAYPGAGETDRFAEADADTNGALSRDEFFTAFPAMKAEAFDALDTDRDASLSRAEWDAFSAAHSGMRQMPPPGGMAGGMPRGEGDLPLLSFPEYGAGHEPENGAEKGPGNGRAGAAPEEGALPLLLPPDDTGAPAPARDAGQPAGTLPLLEPPRP